MRLYDGLPEPGPCEGCGFTTCRCKPASRPVPEPLSQVLRRLHEEATAGPWAMDTREPLDFVLWGPAGEAVGNIGGLCVPVLSDADVDANPDIRRIVEAERNDIVLVATLRNALPALADLVEATESEHALRHGVPGGQKDVGQCFHQCCRALAALRERLAVKP